MTSAVPSPPAVDAAAWWGARRGRYNRALVAAGALAFLGYCAALGARCPDTAEVTVFTTLFQGVGYLLAMALANVCYGLGPAVERLVPPAFRGRYRRWAFAAGLAFSAALPFCIPLLILTRGCAPSPE